MFSVKQNKISVLSIFYNHLYDDHVIKFRNVIDLKMFQYNFENKSCQVIFVSGNKTAINTFNRFTRSIETPHLGRRVDTDETR